MGRLLIHVAFVGLVFVGTSSFALAEEWGDLSLRIVYDAPVVPKPKPLAAAAGVAFCGGLPLAEESLLVGAKDKGVANVIVYLFAKSGEKVPIHASYEKTAQAEVMMANKNCSFEPRVAVMRTSQTFVGTNPDPTGHNMKADFFNNGAFNDLVPAGGGSVRKRFPQPETTPTPISCSIHPWMGGHLLIRDDPYAAVSDKSGKLTIPNLPAGAWTFIVWHERAGYISKASVAGKEVEWKRGRAVLEIKPGKNDLGDVLVKPEVFK